MTINSENIAALETIVGAAIIIFSLFPAFGIRSDLKRERQGGWALAMALMGFFFLGYVLSVLVLLGRLRFPLELVTGTVFLGGACFVFIVVRLSQRTVRLISLKDRDIEDYAGGLSVKASELEREIAERKQAEEQASLRLGRLSALHTVDMTISSSIDIEVTLSILLDQVSPQLGVDAACILLLDPNTQVLKYSVGKGFRTPYIKGTTRKVGSGSAGVAALERRIVRIADLGESGDAFDRKALVEGEDFVSYFAVPLVAKGQVNGVLEIFNRSPFSPGPEWLDFLKAFALQAAIAIDGATLFNKLQRSNAELIIAYDSTLEGWARALELRDEETEGHTKRVVEKTLEMARAMGVGDEELVHIRRGAFLHDIGKMSIPDSILLKRGSLNEEEWGVMRRHPSYAFELLSPIAYLRPALDIPYCHHEKWDGTGYPRGLKGEQIPLAARIFAVVDTWDALCSERRYHAAWDRRKVCAHMRSLAGTHFDPKVVGVFLGLECASAEEGEETA